MNDKITCPNCAHDFAVEEALSGKLEAQYKAEYERKIRQQADKFNSERLLLAKEIEAFELKKEKQNELFKERLDQRLVQEKEKIQVQNQRSLSTAIGCAHQEENARKQAENRELKAAEIDLLKRENLLKEKAEELQLNG